MTLQDELLKHAKGTPTQEPVEESGSERSYQRVRFRGQPGSMPQLPVPQLSAPAQAPVGDLQSALLQYARPTGGGSTTPKALTPEQIRTALQSERGQEPPAPVEEEKKEPLDGGRVTRALLALPLKMHRIGELITGREASWLNPAAHINALKHPEQRRLEQVQAKAREQVEPVLDEQGLPIKDIKGNVVTRPARSLLPEDDFSKGLAERQFAWIKHPLQTASLPAFERSDKTKGLLELGLFAGTFGNGAAMWLADAGYWSAKSIGEYKQYVTEQAKRANRYGEAFDPETDETARELKRAAQITTGFAALVGLAAPLRAMRYMKNKHLPAPADLLPKGIPGPVQQHTAFPLAKGLAEGTERMVRPATRFAFKTLTTVAEAPLYPLRKMDQALSPVTNYVWKNVLVKAANARLIPTWESTGKKGSVELVKKSLAEITQPAIERMPKQLQSTFRSQRAAKANITAYGERFGQRIEELSPAARYEAMQKAGQLKEGVPTDFVFPEAKAAVEELWQGVRGQKVSGKHEEALYEQLDKLLFKNVVSMESGMGVSTDTMHMLTNLEAAVTGSVSLSGRIARPALKAIRKDMGRILKTADDTMDVKMYTTLKDTYNASAHSAEAVAEAAKDTFTAILAKKLKAYSGVVRAEVPAGQEKNYLQSQFPPFKDKRGIGLYVDRDVELELRTLEELPKISHSLWNRFFMTPWKTLKLMDRPAVYVRNGFSNHVLNWMGGLSPFRMDVYADGLMQMRKQSKNWKDFTRMTGGGGTFSLTEVMQLQESMKFGASWPDKVLGGFDKAHSYQRAFYNAQEQWSKFSKYLHNLERGMSPTEAALDAVKWTFNYSEVTRATARVRGYIAPFYTWQSKIIPMMTEAAVKHPVQFGSAILMYQLFQQEAIKSAGFTESEWERTRETLPEYIRNGMYLMMPWRDDEGRLNMLNLTYMVPGFGDLVDASSNPGQWALSNPLITIPGSLLNNRRFSGAPIYYDWEDPSVRAAKMFGYVWEQMMPATMPGGVDWNMAWDTFRDAPNSLSPMQATAAMAGLKVTPIDPHVARKRARALRDIHLSEIKSSEARELREARTDAEKQRIKNEYREIYRRKKRE